jgi:hypothetical protein
MWPGNYLRGERFPPVAFLAEFLAVWGLFGGEMLALYAFIRFKKFK